MSYTNLIIPIVMLLIMVYALAKDMDAYNSFIAGAKEGLTYAIEIIPFVLGMIVATSVFQVSGFMTMVTEYFEYLKINILPEIFTLAVFRPISGVASLAVLNDIFDRFGPDSVAGILASVMQGSTDTTLYVITVYFGAVGVKNYRHAVKAGILVDVFSFICAFFVVKYLIGIL